VRWTNTAGPTLWRFPANQVPSIVAGYPPRAGRRAVYLATTARLVALGRDDQKRPTFEGEVLKVDVYGDHALTNRAGTLPATPP